VPAGEFSMGSQAATGFWKSMLGHSIPANETPQHVVKLDEYFMGKYPVTKAQFAAFVRSKRYPWVKSASALTI